MIEVMAYQCEATGKVYLTKRETLTSEIVEAGFVLHEGTASVKKLRESAKLLEASVAAYLALTKGGRK